jgi:hypothetical protein
MRSSSGPAVVAVLSVALGCLGCSSDPANHENPFAPASPPPVVSPIVVTVAPSYGYARRLVDYGFTATVANDTTHSGVRWTLDCGTSSSVALYGCGTLSASGPGGLVVTYSKRFRTPAYNLGVTATSIADPTKTGHAGFEVD